MGASQMRLRVGLHGRTAGHISGPCGSSFDALAVHLETLKVFCDVVETRSFSAAASQNFVTQSAVSQQIRSLEERYGRRLLERTRGNVQLTPARSEEHTSELQSPYVISYA